MPLNKGLLQSTIEDALNAQSMQPSRSNPITSVEQDADNQIKDSNKDLAKKLADAIDAFVKSGTVNTTVTTTGTAAAQTGTGTGSIT